MSNISYQLVRSSEQLKKLYSLDDLAEQMFQEDAIPTYVVGGTTMHFAIMEDDEIVGIALGTWMANRLLKCDFGILKKFRGPGSAKYGQFILNDLQSKLPGLKFMLLSLEYKPHATKYAEACGFRRIAEIKNSLYKDGKYYSNIVMERD